MAGTVFVMGSIGHDIRHTDGIYITMSPIDISVINPKSPWTISIFRHLELI